MFQAMNQGWANSSISFDIQNNSISKTRLRWIRWWMLNIAKRWPSNSIWWWCSKCTGRNLKKKWDFKNGRCSNNFSRSKSKKRLRDGKIKWRWKLALTRLSYLMKKSNPIFLTVPHLCLKLWWMIPIHASRILSFCISSRGYKKEKL